MEDIRTADQLKAAVEERLGQRSERYIARAREVLGGKLLLGTSFSAAEGRKCSGIACGSNNERYSVTTHLNSTLASTCTCQSHAQDGICKHAIALALHVLQSGMDNEQAVEQPLVQSQYLPAAARSAATAQAMATLAGTQPPANATPGLPQSQLTQGGSRRRMPASFARPAAAPASVAAKPKAASLKQLPKQKVARKRAKPEMAAAAEAAAESADVPAPASPALRRRRLMGTELLEINMGEFQLQCQLILDMERERGNVPDAAAAAAMLPGSKPATRTARPKGKAAIRAVTEPAQMMGTALDDDATLPLELSEAMLQKRAQLQQAVKQEAQPAWDALPQAAAPAAGLMRAGRSQQAEAARTAAVPVQPLQQLVKPKRTLLQAMMLDANSSTQQTPAPVPVLSQPAAEPIMPATLANGEHLQPRFNLPNSGTTPPPSPMQPQQLQRPSQQPTFQLPGNKAASDVMPPHAPGAAKKKISMMDRLKGL